MAIVQREFLTYDPYLTFSDPFNSRFIKANGEHGKELNPDTQALFRIGREAFKRLPAITSKEAFDRSFVGYGEFIEQHRLLLQALDQLGKLDITSLGAKLKVHWESAEDHQILGIAWQILSTWASTEAVVKEKYKVTFLFHALIEIDNAAIGIELDGRGAIAAATEAANALSNAVAFESGSKTLQEARRDLAYQGAIARIERDPRQKEKAFIFECWQKWQQDSNSYVSKAAFARDMLTKCEHLTSQKKIEDWCREWEIQNGTQQAE